MDALVGGGFADVEGYRRYLQGMRRFLSASERVLGSDWPLAPLQVLLQQDLAALGTRPAAPPSTDGAPVGDDASRLGHAYVVGGASMGARQLLRDATALGFGPGRSADFLDAFARGDLWPDVLARLDTARLDAEQTGRCRAAALAAFANAEDAFGRTEMIDD